MISVFNNYDTLFIPRSGNLLFPHQSARLGSLVIRYQHLAFLQLHKQLRGLLLHGDFGPAVISAITRDKILKQRL